MSDSRTDKIYHSKDEEINPLEEALRQREFQNTDKDKTIQSLERALQQKDILISRQCEEIVRLRGIEKTLSWRGMRRLFDLTEKILFPPGTGRGRLFFRMLNRLKANLEEVPGRDPYSEKVAAEMGAFEEMTNVHDLPPIHSYWSEKFLMPKLRQLGIQEFWNLFVDPVSNLWRQSGRRIVIASLGSGNCDFELQIARQIHQRSIPFEMHCYEFNPAMLSRGKVLVEQEGLEKSFRFIECDMNRVRFDQKYDLFIANHSLHHFVNLEHIFQSVRSAMRTNGYFVVNDMIGRNGHMLWPEAYEIFSRVWSTVSKEKKFNHQNRMYEETYPNWDYATGGFEGIRAQDILPLLIQSFKFELFCAFNNITDLFIGRCFGPNFKPDDPKDLALIDYVAHLDETCIREGKIKPTHLIAWMVLETPQKAQFMDGLTPERCVRKPSAGE